MTNKKGSVLVLTLMLFMVLTILGSAILTFMLAENKQAIHFQNKTQAHYIARSGAEVVEAALIEQLNSYLDDNVKQKAFVDLYESPGIEIDPKVEYAKPVLVVNEIINGRRVMTIKSEAEYKGIKQSVKKVLYSTESRITKTNNGQFIPAGGELFVYLGDIEPKQFYKNGNGWAYVPETYVRKVDENEKDQFKTHPFPTVDNWSVPNSIVVSGNKINGGTYSLPSGETNLYVDGSLTMDGNIRFNGTVNIYVKGTLTINNNTHITGDTETLIEGKTSKLNIFVYNTENASTAVTTPLASNISIVGNLYVEKGDVSISVHQSGYIDGHIIYNGTGNVDFSSDSNNFTGNKLITGSIYAPFGTVRLGIHHDKTANIIGGQVIANTINVYANNNTQANKFYGNSSKGRINNPIPVNITQNIDIKQIKYESFYTN